MLEACVGSSDCCAFGACKAVLVQHLHTFLSVVLVLGEPMAAVVLVSMTCSVATIPRKHHVFLCFQDLAAFPELSLYLRDGVLA